MRLKLLLFALLVSVGILNAQTPPAAYNKLLLTEAYLGGANIAYFEITNMGDQSVNLKEFKFAELRPWGNPPWEHPADRWWMLPDYVLAPGKSFVITGEWEFGPRQFRAGKDGYGERQNKPDMVAIANQVVQVRETNGDETDKIDEWATNMWTDIWGGRSCFFLEHHLSETDSVVVDQVNGWFDGTNGLNIDKGGYDIAGVTKASANSYLIRKYSVKQGNLDFANAAGIGEDDGEWIVVPQDGGVWRDILWTVGNHGDYKLNETTLESTVADINFANKTITVPWGTRRGDGIMKLMKKKPGIAWNYVLSPVFADSLSFAAATGDQLKIIVAGNTGYRATFDIIVAPPTADANVVVPMSNQDPRGGWRTDNEDGILGWPRVTANASGMDTIWGARGGIPYATRVDTLLERLHKPANATWEFEWVDGVPRADLKNGDKLKVKSASGKVKSYHIAVLPFRPAHDAYLSAITWPDIPEFYKGIFGWKGDTIPGFSPTVYNYRISVPLDVDGIPALVAKKVSLNSKVEVQRAASINGTTEQRTVKFIVTAQDDSVRNTYTVELVKEKNPANLQPYHAEPLLSELVFWEQWSNSFGEIVNPGNQPLDLSNYMIAMQWNTDPSGVIRSRMEPTEWLDRYDKYVPGYKWVDEAQWQVTPGRLKQDLNINPILMPGEVFTFGAVYTDGQTWPWQYVWPIKAELDLCFNNYTGARYTFKNPWNENVSGNGSPIRKWHNSNWYMFKILNDSVKLGLKPANDPEDFELIENFGMADGSTWVIGGKQSAMITNFIRKPHVYKPNKEFQGSFGTTPENSEWTWTNQAYWSALGVGWSQNILYVGHDIGKHFMNTPTHYMSTVNSTVYLVSEGYSQKETIKGIKTGASVSDLLANLIKPNENQKLKVESAANGAVLAMDALLTNKDILVVTSADSSNTSKYILDVSTQGLSSNAVLTSSRYEITIVSQPKSAGADNAGQGTVKGFDYGTSLKTVLANIQVPPGARYDVIDGKGAYVATKALNFDTTYVNVTVNDNIFIDVVAENGVTRIVYQLIPTVAEDQAFITSDLYAVSQKDLLVTHVPRGSDYKTFMSNIFTSAGATMKLVDKMGHQRIDGVVADDDKVVVTSPNKKVTTVYHISMLSELYVRDITYLAYLLSKSYSVDQVTYKIYGVSGAATIPAFYSNISVATGAKAMVVDKNGKEKTTGDIDGSDKVKVTSADGRVTVMYSFGPLTSADVVEGNSIKLYPNPTNGKINISGVEAGNRIQVYNSVGAIVRDVDVQRNIELISLDKEPSGMYMIVISNNNKTLGRYKAIKK